MKIDVVAPGPDRLEIDLAAILGLDEAGGDARRAWPAGRRRAAMAGVGATALAACAAAFVLINRTPVTSPSRAIEVAARPADPPAVGISPARPAEAPLAAPQDLPASAIAAPEPLRSPPPPEARSTARRGRANPQLATIVRPRPTPARPRSAVREAVRSGGTTVAPPVPVIAASRPAIVRAAPSEPGTRLALAPTQVPPAAAAADRVVAAEPAGTREPPAAKAPKRDLRSLDVIRLLRRQ